ncbi:MAG: TonB family protein, partial [Candidatus Omnitrophica bacterium]|nr:TonB family protein [Candidatus Omnitrophota bacterium]
VDLVQVKEEESVIDIDVQVMELTKDATNTLGLSWPEKITLTEVGSPGILEAGTKWSTLFKILNLNRAAFAFTLDALVQEGKAQILSRPRLACQSGKEAELTVGGEKPVFTTQVSGSSGGQGTSVEYKNYGIKLKVKPTLTDEKRIKLSVNVEVSDVGAPETIGTTGGSSGNTTTAKAYPLVKRSASTELYLDNGQTMVIGGLMKKKTEEDIRKVPGLGNLPIIGLVFRKKITKEGGGQGERGDVELFITLTPTVTSEEKKAPKQPDKDISQDNRTAVKEESLDPIASYAKIIKERILVNLTYPNDLKDARYQGTVKLSLRISYTGELLEVTVIESSGYRLLDEQAILMVKNAGSFPPFPTSIEQNELWIEAPIMYQLN